MAKSKIEWCDRVWNPVTGCTKISPGCANCYAERQIQRFGEVWKLPHGKEFTVTLLPEKLEQPLSWTKPSKVFVCSMADLFHRDVPFGFIHEIWDIMKSCPQHTFLVLTKRPEKMKETLERIYSLERLGWAKGFWNHVWLGVTAEDQAQADKRIPVLLSIPAAVRFVSVEPMLGPIRLDRLSRHSRDDDWTYIDDALTGFKAHKAGGWYDNKLDHVICGGESGPGARPMHPDWVRSLRDQCTAAGVPFMFKQWGEWWPISQMPDNADDLYYPPPEHDLDVVQKCRYQNGALQLSGELLPIHESGSWGYGAMQTFKVGKKKSGRLLDGQLWDQYPEVRP